MNDSFEEVDSPKAPLVGRRSTLEASQGGLFALRRLEALGRMTGGVAHDFNNLLAIISGYVDLLGDANSAANVQETAEALAEMRFAIDRGSALTRQLLTFARPPERALEFLRPGPVLEGMSGRLRQLVSRDINLQIRVGKNLGWLRIEPAPLEQVILNLVINARDAVSPGGKIELSIERVSPSETFELAAHNPAAWPAQSYTCIVVEDDGMGIHPDMLEYLFEPFFTSKGDTGTGLGLATVHDTVYQNGGFITVESQPGKGSRFGVYLPVHEEAPLEGPSRPEVPKA